MKKTIARLNQLSLPLVILMASVILGGFYYASETSKQESIERQQQIKIEQNKQELSAKEQAKKTAEQFLGYCISEAEDTYKDLWHRTCKDAGKLTNRCLSLYEMDITEYAGEKNIPIANAWAVYFLEKDECSSCGLPQFNADRLNKRLQDDKDECYRRYPQK